MDVTPWPGNRAMDRDRVKGIWNKAKGAVKKGAGRASGDRKMEAEGHIEKDKGGGSENRRGREGQSSQ